jgi:cardiolipin synthase
MTAYLQQLDLVGLLIGLWALVAICTAGHALLSKDDPRSAWGWIAVCWLFPFAGPMLYFFFGINRLRRYAQELGHRSGELTYAEARHPDDIRHQAATTALAQIPPSLEEVVRIADALTGRALLGGNTLLPLRNGEQAYPRMLDAIARAQHCVCLASYLFDADATGRQFIDALAAAQQRGVAVRVLLDGIGERYHWPVASKLLRKRGVPVARFNPPRLLPPSLHINLRNHRKLLWVDGEVAYTGGINIGDRHLVESDPARHVADTHFEIRGAVLNQLAESFVEDWLHASGERGSPLAAVAANGDAVCRVITDGPHEDVDALSHLLQGAVSAAKREVRIMTPYFVPPPALASELVNAALRGVRVEVFLPAHNNLPFVQWASYHALQPLLQRGVHVYEQPPPFRHDKLFIVDGAYAQIGSANFDARSLRLNFEMNVEIYDRAFARDLNARFDAASAESKPITLQSLAQRGLAARLRDAICWLFSPYL